MKKTLVVNLYSGPSAGKTTLAAGVFSQLKKKGVNCELVPEYARDLTLEEAYKTLQNQIYVFAHQFHRLWRINKRVDVAVVDSPLLLTLAYDSTGSKPFRELVYEQYLGFQNLDYLIKRELPFDASDKGRAHDLEESVSIDNKIKEILDSFNVNYSLISPGEEERIVADVLQHCA